MKVKLSSLPVWSCFGSPGQEKKIVEDGRVASIKGKRVSYRKMKGDPEVEPAICPLRLLGVGHRRHHPEILVQIGDGNILKGRR